MICPKCVGFRYQRITGNRHTISPFYEECDYCDGAGVIHCCEGVGDADGYTDTRRKNTATADEWLNASDQHDTT